MPKTRTKAQQTARTQQLKQLEREYTEYRNKANRRMRSLERLSEQPGYKPVLQYAYRRAVYDINALGTEGQRFPTFKQITAEKTNIWTITAYLNTARTFIQSPSSTKTGIDRIYKKRAETTNRKYKTDFTMDDVAAFYESALWKKLNSIHGSKVAMKIVAKVQKNADDIIDEANEARRRHDKIEFESLKNVDGLNLMSGMKVGEKKVIENLAKIYAGREP